MLRLLSIHNVAGEVAWNDREKSLQSYWNQFYKIAKVDPSKVMKSKKAQPKPTRSDFSSSTDESDSVKTEGKIKRAKLTLKQLLEDPAETAVEENHEEVKSSTQLTESEAPVLDFDLSPI